MSNSDSATHSGTEGNVVEAPVKQSLMGRLVSVYGMRFLVMVSICAHWNKGFGKAHQRQTFKLLMTQGYKIHGSHFDTLEAISLMPAALAPAFTILSEFFPLGGYHKLYYLFGSLVIGTLGLLYSSLMSPVEGSPEICTFGIFLGQFAWMACDCFSQGLYSDVMSRHPETGPDLVMFVWIGQQIAGVLAATLGGVITDYVSEFAGLSGLQWSNMLLVIPTFLAIYPAYMNWLGEKKIDPTSDATSKIRESFKKERVVMVLSLMFGAFALLFAFTGLLVKDKYEAVGIDREHVMIFVTLSILFSEGFLAYRYLNSLIGKLVIFNLVCRFSAVTITGAATHFYFDSPEAYPDGPHLSKVFVTTVCGALAFGVSAAALPLYNIISKKMKYRALYFWLIILAVLFKLTTVPLYARWNKTILGINDHVWMIFMTISTRVTGLLYEMPQNLLMSRACPKSLGTTAVAMIGSSINFAFNANKSVSGAICKFMGVNPIGGGKGPIKHDETSQFDNLYLASFVICCIKLAPLFFLWLLPNVKTTEALFDAESDYAKSALRVRVNKKEQKEQLKALKTATVA